jgi:hypothetical protein
VGERGGVSAEVEVGERPGWSARTNLQVKALLHLVKGTQKKVQKSKSKRQHL